MNIFKKIFNLMKSKLICSNYPAKLSKTVILTISEWDDLGFYYEIDDLKKTWIFKGSIEGLNKFCQEINKYIENPKHKNLHEHDHYGPYMYLTISTKLKPEISKGDIGGSIDDLRYLSQLIISKLSTCSPGDVFTIKSEYASKAEYGMQFFVMPKTFIPAEADIHLLK